MEGTDQLYLPANRIIPFVRIGIEAINTHD